MWGTGGGLWVLGLLQFVVIDGFWWCVGLGFQLEVADGSDLGRFDWRCGCVGFG